MTNKGDIDKPEGYYGKQRVEGDELIEDYSTMSIDPKGFANQVSFSFRAQTKDYCGQPKAVQSPPSPPQPPCSTAQHAVQYAPCTATYNTCDQPDSVWVTA